MLISLSHFAVLSVTVFITRDSYKPCLNRYACVRDLISCVEFLEIRHTHSKIDYSCPLLDDDDELMLNILRCQLTY